MESLTSAEKMQAKAMSDAVIKNNPRWSAVEMTAKQLTGIIRDTPEILPYRVEIAQAVVRNLAAYVESKSPGRGKFLSGQF